MLLIKKQKEPEFLSEFKKEYPGKTYDSEELRQYRIPLNDILRKEQKGLCAYCCGRIKENILENVKRNGEANMDFRHELVLPNEDLPFRLFVFEGKDGNYKVSKHWHRSIEIFLVLEGGIDFYINAQRYRLLPGEFMLVNSNEVHSIDSPEPNFTLVLQIPRGLFENYMKDADHLLFRRSCQSDAELVSLIRRMQELYTHRQSGDLFHILSDFYKMMYLLVTDYRILEVDEERRRQNKNLDRLSKITSYIQVNYRENLTLEGVAHIFGFSPAYLSKMFQKYAGINYKAYLLDLRTEAGYRLLMNTELAVGEIALECGFPDSRSVAKAFRRRYGMTPAEYRKKRIK